MLPPYIFKTIENESYAIPNQDYWKEINQKKFSILLKKSGIPKFYWDVEFKDYVGELSKDNVDKLQYMVGHIYEEKFKDINLYIWGTETGTQKSALACSFGRECIKKRLQVKFMLFGSFVNYLMKLQGFNRDIEADEKIKELTETLPAVFAGFLLIQLFLRLLGQLFSLFLLSFCVSFLSCFGVCRP